MSKPAWIQELQADRDWDDWKGGEDTPATSMIDRLMNASRVYDRKKEGQKRMSDTLMNLTDQYLQLLELGESLDPEDQQTYLDTLEGLTAELAAKVDSYAVVYKRMEGKEKYLRDVAAGILAKADALERNKKTLKDCVKVCMEAMDKTKLDGDTFSFRIQKNGGVLPLEITGDVPPEYQKTKIEIVTDNEKIREALKTGKELPFARFGERGTQIRIV